MLKKWLKKRRKGSSRHGGAEPATRGEKPKDVEAAGRHGRHSDGRGKKNKTKTQHGRSRYKNMEKESSRQSLPTQSFMKANLESTPSSVPALHTYRDHAPISPPFDVPPHKSDRVVQDFKKEVPLVRIRPIEKPKLMTKSRERRPSAEQAASPPPHTSLLADPASIDPAPKTPIIVLPPPAQRPASPLGLITNLAEVSFPSPSPPSPTTDHLSREMSYLGTSPPSIDTTLFAHEERKKADGKDEEHSSDERSLTADDISPPTLIEAILPPKQVPKQTATKHVASPVRRSPVDQEPVKLSGIKPVTVQNESDDSEASVRSRSEIIQDIVRPFQDGEFFTATRSQSGSGSEKLETWLEEVLRSIDAQKGQTMTEFDRYHIQKGKFSEEKADKDESSWADGEASEVLVRSRNMIDQALKESIRKSKTNLTSAPRGILKSKVVESGTIRYDPEKWDYSHSEEDEDYEEAGEEKGYAAMVSEESSSEDAVPIKVFSSSRRQKPFEDTEDETVSVESHTSTSEEITYETLRQLKPTVSRDDTQTSNNSSNFFYNRFCTMSNIILDTEEGLCQADDGVSISEYSLASRSTVSKEDSYVTQSGGWMCFDAF